MRKGSQRLLKPSDWGLGLQMLLPKKGACSSLHRERAHAPQTRFEKGRAHFMRTAAVTSSVSLTRARRLLLASPRDETLLISLSWRPDLLRGSRELHAYAVPQEDGA